MYRIIDKRGTGKTSRLMLLAKENNGTIVCKNPSSMKRKCYNYGITGVDFISYYDFIYNSKDRIIGNYFIDEIENFLKFIIEAEGKFCGYTLSNED